MTSVTDIADHRPHITLSGVNRVHVIPVELIGRVVAGKLSVAALDAELIRDILVDWLTQVQDES